MFLHRPGFHPQVPGDHKGGKDKRSLAHVKKPLNAFMLYMKEMRPKIAAECTLKESAAINQILGKRVGKFYFLVQLGMACEQALSRSCEGGKRGKGL